MPEMNNNPVLAPDANGKTYLYGTHLLSGCVPRFTARLAQEVDGGVLQRAADRALERFPQMAVGIAQSRSQYFLLPIDLPAPVFADTRTIRSMGTDDTNAYLFCITYEGNTIHAHWLRALADGPGFLVFFKTVLYYYLKLRGLPVENDGTIRDGQTQFCAEEAEDAVLRLAQDGREDDPRLPAFRVPGPSANELEETLVEIRLPLDKLRGAAEEYQAGPAAFICPLFSAAVCEKHCAGTEYKAPVVAAVSVDMRQYYPSATTRNFTACAEVPYDKEMAGLPVERMLNRGKAAFDFGAQELAHNAKKNALETLRLLDSDLGLEEKCAAVRDSLEQASERATYAIADMGGISLPPSMEAYVEALYPCVPAALNPFALAMVSYQGELVVNVAQRGGDTGVCERFAGLMNELGIPAQIVKVGSFRTMRYGA